MTGVDTDFNASLDGSIRSNVLDMEHDLLERETAVAYGRLMRELAMSEAWRHVLQDLKTRERRAVDQLLQPGLAMQQVGRVQGYIRALRLLSNTPEMSDKEIGDIESGLPALREQIRTYKNLLAGQAFQS